MASLPEVDEPLGTSYWAQFSATSASPVSTVSTVAPSAPQAMMPAATVAVPQQVVWQIGRPSRKALMATGAVLVLLIGGIVAYQVFKPAPPSPDSAVREYFADLASGDTVAALKLVDPSELPNGSNPLLTAQALARPADRPTALTVVSTDKSYGGGSGSVQVTYHLGAAAVRQTITVDESQGSGSSYLLHDPFISLTIPNQGGRTVQINGIGLSADDQNVDQSITVFPGVYHASIAGDALLRTETADAKITDSYGGDPEFSVDFAAPTLAPTAQAAVEAQVRQQIDTCASVTAVSAGSAGCPFGTSNLLVDGTVTSIQWTVTAYPQVQLSVASDPSATGQVDVSDPNQDGSVHYTAQYTDYSGATQTTTGDQSFGFDGTAAVSAGQVQVTAR